MNRAPRQPNEPGRIALTFVLLVNLVLGLVQPGQVWAAVAPFDNNSNNNNPVGSAATDAAGSNFNALTTAPTRPDSPLPSVTADPSQLQAKAIAKNNYGNLPISFEVNRGQTDKKAQYIARGQGYTLFFTKDKTIVDLHKDRGPKNKLPSACSADNNANPDSSSSAQPQSQGQGQGQGQNKSCVDDPGNKAQSSANNDQGLALNLGLVGANSSAQVQGQDPLPGKTNYFISDKPGQWQTDVPTYARLVYKDVYPGIDLSYFGNQRQLEYDFSVSPYASPSSIAFQFEGADKVELAADGILVLHFGKEVVKQPSPTIYQEVGGGARQSISGGYVKKGNNNNTFGFEVGNYNHALPLIIDPVLNYSTYLGGNNSTEAANALAVDSSGQVYLVGSTTSAEFPTTSGVYAASAKGGTDIFVTKLNASGSGLLYSTYLGGTNTDYAWDIVADGSGNAYLTGQTNSIDFPVTTGVYHTTLFGGIDTFVTKLNSTGTALSFSTYLGSSGDDFGYALAIDSSSNVYVTGQTFGTSFPVTTGAYRTTSVGGGDAFVTKLNSTGASLTYSTYLGGSGSDVGYGLTVDASGNAFVTGQTSSTNYPTSNGAYRTTAVGGGDTFVTKLNSTGKSLGFSTYLGGSGNDYARDIALDSSGNPFVTGYTSSTNFPTTAGVYQNASGGGLDAFVTKFNSTGTTLTYSTYLGGSSDDYAYGLSLDSSGNAYVAGFTGSTNFPTTAGVYQTTNSGGIDSFVAKLNSAGSTLTYATYLGGSGDDFAKDLALDSSGNVYLAGYTLSANFPTTSGVYQPNTKGGQDAFVAKINSSGNALTYATYLGGSGDDYAPDIAVDSSGNAFILGYSSSTDFPTTSGAYQTTAHSGGEVILAKLNSDGGSLAYSTFLGGSGDDYGRDIDIDSSGNAYVTGYTTSGDFPTTSGSYQATARGGQDGFAFKLNASGNALTYSTYLGSSGTDTGWSIAVDTSGNAYVSGYTNSASFPTSSGAFQTTFGGGEDVFALKLNTTGTAIVYSTYLGGSGTEDRVDIDVDTSGNLYILGDTTSSNFPTTANAYNRTLAGGVDSFVTKLNTTGTALLYSTYFGGSDTDFAGDVYVDSNNLVYAAGQTFSTNLPVTSGAYQGSMAGVADVYVAKLDPSLNGTSSLIYSTYVGGSNNDFGYGISVDSSGNAFVTGGTASTNFPTTSGAYQTAYGGGTYDAFLSELNPAGTALLYSTFLGGSGLDYSRDLGLDSLGNVYLNGGTTSADFPTTNGVYQTTAGTGWEIFVSKLVFTNLAFTTQPAGGQAGQALSSQPVVTVKNLDGSTRTSFSGPISLTIKSGTGATGATLAGTTTVNAVNGVATFSGLSIDRAGTGYILSASGGPLLGSVDSAPFDISGGSSIVAYSGSNQNTAISTAFGSPLVALVRDGSGNPISGKSVTFTAPGSGATGTFAGGSASYAGTTDASGLVTTTAFTANGTAGNYSVSAAASGIAIPVNFILNNSPSTSDLYDVKLKLEPVIAGPNTLSNTRVITVTATRHDFPLGSGQPITVNVTGSSGSPLTLTGNTALNGQAVLTYTRTTAVTDTLAATTTYNGTPVQSNQATVYWSNSSNPVSFSSVFGRYYSNCSGCAFQATPSSTPIFTQTYPTINFEGTYGPFTDIVRDPNNESVVTDTIVAQGNGHSMGTGGDVNFDGVYTGQLFVPQTGQITFLIRADDTYRLGIGNGASCAGGTCSSPGSYTPFENLPLLSAIGTYNYAVYVTINFPQPGYYPFELDYTQQYAPPMAMVMLVAATSNSIKPTGYLKIAPSSLPDKTVGQASDAITLTATDLNNQPWSNQPILVNISGPNSIGPNPSQITVTTDISGVATLVYTGTNPGTDQIQAVTFVDGSATYSTEIRQNWLAPTLGTGSGGESNPQTACSVTSGWLSSPTSPSNVTGLVPVTLNSGITLPAGAKVQYFPADNPSAAALVTVYTTTTTVNGPATLTNLDTTLLANGSYILRIVYTDGSNNCQSNLSLIRVMGENKPGRVAFSLTDVTVPVAGMPVVIGRTYDSLNRNNLGDFGYGWDLSISSPKLEVNPAGDVTLTLLDGKRVTFYFTPSSSMFGFGAPIYTPETGVYGSLNQSTCSAVTPISSGGYVCFPGGRYDPASYSYRDPYGRVYTIGRDSSGKFKLTKLADLNGNTLTFSDTGISSSSLQSNLGQLVQFNRASSSDPNCPNCIQSISVINQPGQVFTYTNSTGDLTKITLPQNMPGTSTPISVTYSYYTVADGSEFAHLFKGEVDPRGNTAVTSNYYSDGKLKEVVQPVNSTLTYTTTYTYDQANNITSVTNPDGGTTSSQTDAYGKVISETQQIAGGVYRTTQNTYNDKHQITSSQVGSAPATTYTYDQYGNQSGVTDQLGHTSTTVYNPYGGPLSITDPVSHTWNVSYDDSFAPTVVTDSIGSVGGYTFDSRGSILSRSDGNGKTTTFSYDQYGNKVSDTDPLGNTTRYAYDTLGHVTLVTDTTGVATKNNYDALGRITSTIAAYNSSTPVTTSYTYDANSNKLSQTDAYGRTISYTYDNANRLLQTTYPAVNGVVYSTTTTYDWRGNKLTETDQAGHMTRYGYDLAGQLISTTTGLASNGTATADTATTITEYDNLGRTVKEYNAYSGSGSLPGSQPYTGYQYDAAGRLITMTNQLGYNTVSTYDDAGHKLTQTDANSLSTNYHYDSRGRLDKTTYPTLSGGTVVSETQSYDGAGNLASKTDGNGKTTSYSYDDASRLRSVTNPIGQKTSYNYDGLGQLKTIIDANLHSTNFEYDQLGRQTKKIWPDNSFEQYRYDLLGNQISIRLSDGTTNTFSYDEWNRPKTANYADGRVVTYTYTATGLRSQVTDSSRGTTPVTYGYDNLDRTISIAQPGGNIVSYNYDSRGNQTAITTTVGSVISTTTYSYSDANQLTTVVAPTDPGSVHTTYTYDQAGRRTQQNLPNGVMVQYGYDQLNRLLSINQSKNGVTPLAAYTYTLDLAGNRTGVTEGSGRTIAWSYDNAYRLTSEVDSAANGITTTYSYDAVGNRTSMIHSGVTTNYKYNELDQLTTVLSGTTPTLSYSYVRGDRTQVKDTATNTVLQSYSWDSADRLVGATVSVGSATYAYDADGRRIKQVAGGATTNYLWDETSVYGDVLVETDNSNVIKTSYILGNGDLISQKRASVSSPDYYLKDGQGSVRNLTDSSGNLESGQNYTYDAFGNLTSGQTSPSSNYLYTGQQFDVLTGLYDLRARYYSPLLGNFQAQDQAQLQVRNPSSLNRYNYTAGNPINVIDPTGYNSVELAGTYGLVKSQSEAAYNYSQGRGNGGLYEALVNTSRLIAYMYAKSAAVTLADLLDYKEKWWLRRSYAIAVGMLFDKRTGDLQVGVAFTKFGPKDIPSTVDLRGDIEAAVSLLPPEGTAKLIGIGDASSDIPFITNYHAEDILARWAVLQDSLALNSKGEKIFPYTMLAIASQIPMCSSTNDGSPSCSKLFSFDPEFETYRQIFPDLFSNTIMDNHPWLLHSGN